MAAVFLPPSNIFRSFAVFLRSPASMIRSASKGVSFKSVSRLLTERAVPAVTRKTFRSPNIEMVFKSIERRSGFAERSSFSRVICSVSAPWRFAFSLKFWLRNFARSETRPLSGPKIR